MEHSTASIFNIKFFEILCLIFLFGSFKSHAQVPTRFNHQAVVRDTLGQLMANRTLSLRISLEQSAGGASVVRYREVHQVTTNANGLFTLEVGGGTVEQGQMDSVNWSAGSVFLRTEVDPAGGQNYVLSSHRELLSVPYALHAKTAEVPGLPGPPGPSGSMPPGTQPGEMNYWNGSDWVSVPPGTRGQAFIFCDGVPTWGGCLPEVTTAAVSSIYADRASSGGIVVTDGGAAVSARGVAYGTASGPTISGSITTDGTGTGAFTSTLTGLNALTLYFVRAYASNSVGTVYGNEISFTTITLNYPNSCPGLASISDIDGNMYNTVLIGSQCWITTNLNVSRYRNGDSLSTGLNGSDWNNFSSGAYTSYDNVPANSQVFGKLYNHYAVADNRGICPTGWHVPTDGEWHTLVMFLDPVSDTTCHACAQSSVAGGHLKSTRSQPQLGGWNLPNIGGNNISGFSGLPGGERHDNSNFAGVNSIGVWWTSTLAGSSAWVRRLEYSTGSIYRDYARASVPRAMGFSVRCIKDSNSSGSTIFTTPVVNTVLTSSINSTSAIIVGNITADGGSSVVARGVAFGTSTSPSLSGNFTSNGQGMGTFNGMLNGLTPLTSYFARAYAINSVGTAYGNEVTFTTTAIPAFICGTSSITDVDGNSYATVQIGTQCWIQSNLKVSKYRDGSSIPNITDNTSWLQTNINGIGAWSHYNNDYNNDDFYGKLYNLYAVNDSRGLCPTGWHVPSDAEWNTLVRYLDPSAYTATVGGQSTNAGGALKSTSSWWNSPNTGATNSSGFTALPGGYRYGDYGGGSFSNVGNIGVWWSSLGGSSAAWGRELYNNSADVYRSFFEDPQSGYSVRCARD
jgi:uncharacterized protein (TIGR02145 family)